MTSRPNAQVFVALDMTAADSAERMAAQLSGHVDGVKLGLEFFAANGPTGVERIRRSGQPVFLDLKLHDIPNTVAGAVRAILPLEPKILTVHAAGGRAMLGAAAAAAKERGPTPPLVVAVTVLTSLDEGDLREVGQASPAIDQVLRLADLAQRAGVDGIVCSPLEVAAVRARCGRDFVLVVPGIRPETARRDDQKRVMTPAEAVDAGADVLVIGRPITAAADPTRAARDIAAALKCARP
ncbi:MAG: orotidine-5'-phosphate decarboxylase [Alphaproteobacteria bacterium]